ncbi:MAG: ankyrin repeat domain-containing protein [Brevinema sp.]
MKGLRFLIAFCQAGIVFNPCFLYSIDFFRAVELNMVPQVIQMINDGADINARDKMGYTALHIAAWNGNRELVEYLLQLGANPNIATPSGNTPLKFASPTIRRLLNQYGAYEAPTLPTFAQTGALSAGAAPLINPDITYSIPPRTITRVVSNFISNFISNVTSNVISNFISNTVIITNLTHAQKSYSLLNSIPAKESIEIHSWDENGNNALHRAARNGDLQTVSNLIARGINPMSSNNAGDTALFMAVEGQNLEIVKYLIEVIGVDVNHANRQGLNALNKVKDNSNMLSYLLHMGGNPNSKAFEPVVVSDIKEIYSDDGAYLEDFRALEAPQANNNNANNRNRTTRSNIKKARR